MSSRSVATGFKLDSEWSVKKGIWFREVERNVVQTARDDKNTNSLQRMMDVVGGVQRFERSSRSLSDACTDITACAGHAGKNKPAVPGRQLIRCDSASGRSGTGNQLLDEIIDVFILKTRCNLSSALIIPDLRVNFLSSARDFWDLFEPWVYISLMSVSELNFSSAHPRWDHISKGRRFSDGAHSNVVIKPYH